MVLRVATLAVGNVGEQGVFEEFSTLGCGAFN
jgi:hypothetical protein